MTTTSFVFGIISILYLGLFVLSFTVIPIELSMWSILLFPILAIIFGIVGLIKVSKGTATGRGRAVIGMVLGLISLLLVGGLAFLGLVLMGAMSFL